MIYLPVYSTKGCLLQAHHLAGVENHQEVAMAPGVDEGEVEDEEGEEGRIRIDDRTMRQIPPTIIQEMFRMAIVAGTTTTQ